MEDIGVTLDKEKKERNDAKLLQLELFYNGISTSKIYHTKLYSKIK